MRLQTKTNVITTISVCIMFAIFAVYIYFTQSSQMEEELKETGNLLSIQIVEALSIPLFNFEENSIHSILKSQMLKKDIEGILLANNRNDSISHGFVRDAKDTIIESTTVVKNKNLLKFQRAIEKDNEKLGSITIFLSPRIINMKLRTLIINTITAMILILGILVGILSISLRWILIKPLFAVTTSLREIVSGGGDLRNRLHVKQQDEIGELCHLFNSFLDKLHDLISKIAQNANTLTIASTEMLEHTEKIDKSATTIAKKTTDVSDAIDSVKENLKGISESTTQMSSSVESLSSATEEINASFNEVSKQCEDEALMVKNADENAMIASKVIKVLKEVAGEIGNILSVITDIAGQTNLLALNATIEAAGAGEVGRGFSVVAQEVKDLSKRTSQAVVKIDNQIGSIQGAAEKNFSTIQNIITTISQINDVSQVIVSSVSEQSAVISEVAKDLSFTSTSANSIANNVTSATVNVSTVSDTVAVFSTETTATAKGINDLKNNAQSLKKQADELTEIVNQFQL